MTIPSGPVPSFTPTTGLQSGAALQKLAGLIGSTQNPITAKAGGLKLGATPITGVKARIGTSVTDGDSVLLPPGYPGLEISIYNAAAHSIQVFGSGSDTINAVATGTGVTQATLVSAIYTCYDVVAGVGLWGRVLSA